MIRRILLAAFGFAAIGLAVAWFVTGELREPMRLPGDHYVLNVAAGSSLGTVAEQLGAQGALDYPWVLTAYGRAANLAARIKAGEYEVAPGTTPLGLLQQLVEGRVRLHSLTVVEGWSTRDLLRAVRKHKAIRQTPELRDGPSIARALDLAMENPEGWFFPDTYRFPKGTSDVEILTMAHERMKTVLEAAWQGRNPQLPLKSAYEALILASIVEKETALDRERPQVAGVFTRRLMTGMRLQTDPTVIYGLGEEFDGDLTRRHLLRDTPYNTYTRSGLPPTPIALPGESSLLAAVHPDSSDAIFFVATGEPDGSHAFSATLREHNAAVRRYLAASKDAAK